MLFRSGSGYRVLPTGSYPLTLTQNGLTITPTVTIGTLPTITTIYFSWSGVSTATPDGWYLGQPFASNLPSNEGSWTIGGADAALFSCTTSNGKIYKTNSGSPFPNRNLNITLTVTDRLVSKTVAFSIPCPVGITYSSTNITMTPNPSLDNYHTGQSVGTPAIAGMTGTVAWSLTCPDNHYNSGGTPIALFTCDPTTGATVTPTALYDRMTCPVMLSERNATLAATLAARMTAKGISSGRANAAAAKFGPYQLTYTATNGIDYCNATIAVPVSWYVNPTNPVFYVGPGMSTAHPGIGYEHIVDFQANVCNGYYLGGTVAGATVYISDASATGLNYYANDWSDGSSGQYRLGSNGPIKYKWAGGPGTNRPRVGGTILTSGNGNAWGGYYGDKSTWNLLNGDHWIEGFETSWVEGFVYTDGTSDLGREGIRKNGDTFGQLLIVDCDFQQTNEPILAGTGPYSIGIFDTNFRDGGTAHDGTGTMHNFYIAQIVGLVVAGCKTSHAIFGHLGKSRAKQGWIVGTLLAEGNRGSASCCLDLCDGGEYYIWNCSLEKGLNPQNPYALNWFATNDVIGDLGIEWPINRLTVEDTTIACLAPAGQYYDPSTAINYCTRTINGVKAGLVLNNVSYFMASDAVRLAYTGEGIGSSALTETNPITLTAAPAYDFSDAGSASPPIARASWFYAHGDDTNEFPNWNGVQLDFGNDDIRLSHTASGGTTVANCAAFGAYYWGQVGASSSDPRINPFTSGTTWSLPRDPIYNGSVPWAPSGRYAINSSTGVITTVTAPGGGSAGIDYILVRATALDGTKADAPVSVTVT